MAQELKALLLAAGLGTRLRPLTDVLPKCLMPIDGRPLLGLWLERLCGAGITDIVVNLHHHAALVREYVEHSPFASRVTLAEEPQLLGTAGTLIHNADHFGSAPVLFAHADNVTLFSPQGFANSHQSRPGGMAMTMMTFVTDAPQQCGIVKLDARGTVVEFHEKSPNPPGNLASAAVYIVEPDVIDYARSRRVSDFSTQVVPHFVGRIHTFHNGDYHRDIGTLSSLVQAQFEYPIASTTVATGAPDAWYGLMTRDGHALGRDFLTKMTDAIEASAPAKRTSTR